MTNPCCNLTPLPFSLNSLICNESFGYLMGKGESRVGQQYWQRHSTVQAIHYVHSSKGGYMGVWQGSATGRPQGQRHRPINDTSVLDWITVIVFILSSSLSSGIFFLFPFLLYFFHYHLVPLYRSHNHHTVVHKSFFLCLQPPIPYSLPIAAILLYESVSISLVQFVH